MLKDSINLIYGLNSFEDFYNPYKQQYESADHVYTPDYIGWQDGRVSLKIDEDTLQYFPDMEIWKINNSKTLLRDYLETKNIKGSEEALFWKALEDSEGSDAIDLDFSFIINKLLLRESSKKENERRNNIEEDAMNYHKDRLKALLPLIGEVKYDHSEVWIFNQDIDVFYSRKYGYIYITRNTNFFGEFGLNLDKRFSKTWEYIINHCKNKKNNQMFYKKDTAGRY